MEDMADFVRCCCAEEPDRRKETPHFRRFKYAEIIARDKANLDIQWSPSVAETPKGDTPQALMQEILQDLEEAMREFADVEAEIRCS